ncbi:MAG: hypothetical protein ACOC29_02000, partial [Candidatus Sumerlaeota bacterium]
MKKLLITLGFACLLVLSGCATQIHGPEEPPLPGKILRGYDRVQLTPVSIDSGYADANANRRALRKIEENLYVEHLKIFPDLERVKRNEDMQREAGVMRIEPHIEAIKFVGGASRFFAGSLAGSSAVRMVVRYRDMESGEFVDTPLFYKRANAIGGEWSMGATDNMMLL